MKRTALFVCSYTPSLVNFRGDLISKFLDEGWNVVCLGPSDTPEVIGRVKELGVDFIPVNIDRNGTNPLNDITFFFDLLLNILRLKPQLCISYTIKPVIYTSLASRLLLVPTRLSMVTGLGESFASNDGVSYSTHITFKKKLVSFLARNLFKLGLHCSTHILFQNNDDRSMIIKNSSVSSNKMDVTNGSGVNMRSFPFRERHVSNSLKFVMVSRIIKPKGILQFLECARRVRERYKNAEFHLVGWFESGGDLSINDLQSYISNGDIIFHGKSNNVCDILNECDVFVLPSYYPEGTPRTILEAMSCGMPIITTDSVGCRETVISDFNGYLIPPLSTDSLESACLNFMNDCSLVTKMGKNSFQLASEKYCVHKVNNSIFKALGI
ncbi:glycosyltransferase family 4 protein [Shewanella sp. Isolate8]|uniref:glycosyltransferase family 4 protein n=1 Tax=Shewanella sp. Isolate8 TaxID=2908529 RepID=UPI001EFD6B5B|nr:glycosyltransferase family 4 protein [Shewanella sp. Isolate8]MCG9745903.1 glycosyltransferase family 4 protein [Shewanella sp. Isolate8]